ncbi:MAG TPA: hypothetical protein VLG68_02410 [Gammaproteobacteria bacterium]|nr:hypothetical protein [Gammaproteobacteria bacterium]
MKIRAYSSKPALGGILLAALFQSACGGGTVAETSAADKIAPALAAAASTLAAGKPLDTNLARSDAAGRIQVYVYVSALSPDELKSLMAHGLREALANQSMGVVQGWVSPQDLDALAALPFITRLSLPDYGRTE